MNETLFVIVLLFNLGAAPDAQMVECHVGASQAPAYAHGVVRTPPARVFVIGDDGAWVQQPEHLHWTKIGYCERKLGLNPRQVGEPMPAYPQ